MKIISGGSERRLLVYRWSIDVESKFVGYSSEAFGVSPCLATTGLYVSHKECVG